MIDRIFSDLAFVRTYLDEVLVLSRDINEKEDNLRQVLERIAAHSLKVKISKCSFCQEEVELLGHIVRKNGVSVDLEKLSTIAGISRLTTPTERRNFLGLCGYYRRFINRFSEVSDALHAAT